MTLFDLTLKEPWHLKSQLISGFLTDEPTGNLDPGLSEDILNILKEINQKQQTTVVTVTHGPTATGYGINRIQLSNGKIHTQYSQETRIKIEQLTN